MPPLGAVREDEGEDFGVTSDVLGVVRDNRAFPGVDAAKRVLDLVRQKLSQGRTVAALLAAVRTGNTLEVLDALSQARCDLLLQWQSPVDGNSVVHLVCEYGDAGQLQALINYIKIHAGTWEPPRKWLKQTATASSATTNASGSASPTPAATAAESLIFACLNRTNHLRQTPLMFAAYHGRDEVVQILMKHGSDPWAQDRCGQKTALHYACSKRHAACVRTLLDCLTPAQAHNPAKGMRYVDVPTISGYTALHFAVAVDSVPCIRVLLAYGARIDRANSCTSDDFWVSCARYSTPLHLAACMGHIQSAMAILRHYADVQQGMPRDPTAHARASAVQVSSSIEGVTVAGRDKSSDHTAPRSLSKTEHATAPPSPLHIMSPGPLCCGGGTGAGIGLSNGSSGMLSSSVGAGAGVSSSGGRQGCDGYVSQGSTSLSTSNLRSDIMHQKSDEKFGKVSLATSSMAAGSTASHNEVALRQAACAVDPRRLLDGQRRIPLRVALAHNHDDMVAALHPATPIDDLWTPQDLAKWANSGTVPPLQVIVANALARKFAHSISEAEECLKLLGTAQHAGRVFSRQGVYNPEDCSMGGGGFGAGLPQPVGTSGGMDDDSAGYYGSSGPSSIFVGATNNGGQGNVQRREAPSGARPSGRPPSSAPSLLGAASATELDALMGALGIPMLRVRAQGMGGASGASPRGAPELSFVSMGAPALGTMSVATPAPARAASAQVPVMSAGRAGSATHVSSASGPGIAGPSSKLNLATAPSLPAEKSFAGRSGSGELGMTQTGASTEAGMKQLAKESRGSNSRATGEAVSVAPPSQQGPLVSPFMAFFKRASKNAAYSHSGFTQGSSADLESVGGASPRRSLEISAPRVGTGASVAPTLQPQSHIGPPRPSIPGSEQGIAQTPRTRGSASPSVVAVKALGGFGPCAPAAVFLLSSAALPVDNGPPMHGLRSSIGSQLDLPTSSTLEGTSGPSTMLSGVQQMGRKASGMSVALVRTTTATALLEHAVSVGARIGPARGAPSGPGPLAPPFVQCVLPIDIPSDDYGSMLAAELPDESMVGEGSILEHETRGSTLSYKHPSSGMRASKSHTHLTQIQQLGLHRNMPASADLPDTALPPRRSGNGSLASGSTHMLSAVTTDVGSPVKGGWRRGRTPVLLQPSLSSQVPHPALNEVSRDGAEGSALHTRASHSPSGSGGRSGGVDTAQLLRSRAAARPGGMPVMQSANSQAGSEQGALKGLKYWLGYERYYVSRGANAASETGGPDASALRRVETQMESRRRVARAKQETLAANARRRKQQAAVQRGGLVGLLAKCIPTDCQGCCDNTDAQVPGLTGSKSGGDLNKSLRPGRDVCGMCMDNRPNLELRTCRHRVCVLCARAMCHALELRTVVSCPFCNAPVQDFTLA